MDEAVPILGNNSKTLYERIAQNEKRKREMKQIMKE